MPEEEKDKKDKKEEETPKKAGGLPKIVKIGLGCLIILIVLAVILAVGGTFLFKKFGISLLQKSIEQKTGLQTNLSDIQNGKITYTDPKTGAKLDVGSGTIPSDFPKDFPIYPDSKVISSLSGNQSGQGNGFWLTLASSDSVDKVKAFYETNLKSQNWTFEATIGSGSGTNWALSKGKLNGYLTIDKSTTEGETSILIVLGETDTVTPPQP